MPRFNNEGRTNKFIHQNHDDRSKFKFTLNRGGIQRKPKHSAFNRLDATGDAVMVEANANAPGTSRHVHFEGTRGRGKAFRNKSWRKGQNQGQGGQSHIQHQFGPGWHRLTIYNGKAFDKNYLLQSLAQMCRIPFVPVCYSVFGINTAFFLEQRAEAEALAECSGKLNKPDGQGILPFRIIPCTPPAPAHVDEECENRIKTALDRRYDANLHTLNLENFYKSPELVNDYFLPLYRPSVVAALMKILEPHLDSILGLDLSNNKIPDMGHVSRIINRIKGLRALNMRGNKIRELSSFDRISGASSVIELILEGNPLCENIQDQEAFISAVRKRFPKVIKLDGVDLAAPLSFDVNEPTKLPDVKGSTFCNEQAKGVVLRFWELYVSLYDMDDRQPLLEAYHDNASMSMMCAYTGQAGHVTTIEPSKKLSNYISESRNLTKLPEKGRRFKLLHQGKLDVVSFISKFPKTTHDPTSFVIDMPVAVENFILFTVTGIFKERDDRNTPYRHFSRSFTLVPQNAGFVIVNELLYITNASNEQIRKAFPVIIPTPAATVTTTPLVPAMTATAPLTDDQKRQMLSTFSLQSGMNEEWSKKCLEDNGWDFNKSAMIFTQLKGQNQIPPEAFVR